jgi:hypothetical protein
VGPIKIQPGTTLLPLEAPQPPTGHLQHEPPYRHLRTPSDRRIGITSPVSGTFLDRTAFSRNGT